MPLLLIAGPSSSGKSTVAGLVAHELGLPRFCLDDYFIRRRREFVDTRAGRVRTFERPSLYDGAKLAREIGAIGDAVAEGFCLLSYPEVLALPCLRFYIDVPFAVARARRLARPARPSDVSFSLVGEVETDTYVAPQRLLPAVRVLDGTLSPAALVSIVCDVVRTQRGS